MKGVRRFLFIIGSIVLVLLVVGIVFAAIYDAWLTILYVALIVLAAVTLLSTAMLIYAVFMLIRAISTVRQEVPPLMASVQETMGIVKETAKAASETVGTLGSTAKLTTEFAVEPSIRAASSILAAQQMVRVFMGRGHAAKRSEERRRRQMEAVAEGE